MMRGLHSNRTRGRKARREGGGNQDNPRDEQIIRSVLEYDEQFIQSVPRARCNLRASTPETDSLFKTCLNATLSLIECPPPLCQSARKMRMVW